MVLLQMITVVCVLISNFIYLIIIINKRHSRRSAHLYVNQKENKKKMTNTCACAIKSKQTATSHLYTFIQSNLLSLCKLYVHSLFDHTIPICLCDHHPNEMSSHTFKINFTLSGHEHSKQPNMTSWVKINSKKYIIYNIYIHTTRHIYHNIKNILTIKHDQTLPYFLFSKLC